MAHPRARLHVVRIEVASASSAQQDFNLDPGTHLTHVSANIGVAGTPIRVSAVILQPRARAAAQGSVMAVLGGWIRGMGSNPALSHDLVWNGDILIGTDMAIRFAVRNDTGSSTEFAFYFEVVG